jgi:hypothetical protein
MAKHLRTQKKSNPHTLLCDSEAQRTFLTLHLALPTTQKSLNSMKEWAKFGVFGVTRFIVG